MSGDKDDKSGRPKTRKIGALKQLWPFARRYKVLIGFAGFALVGAAGATLAIGQAVRRMVDYGFGGPGDALAGYLDEYFLALFGVFALLAAFTFARYWSVTWLGERMVADIRDAVYRHVLRLDPAFFENTKTGEVMSRLTVDTELIQTVVGSSASMALRNLLMFIGGLAMLIITSPKLAGMVLAIVPIVIIPIIFFGRRLRGLSRTSQDRVAAVNARAEESLNAVQTVQAFTQEAYEEKRFSQAVSDTLTVARKRIHVRAWLTAVVILLIFGAIDVVLWLGATDVATGAMTSGELTAFVFYAIVVAGSVGTLSEMWGDLQRAAGATERLMELLTVNASIAVPENPVPLPERSEGRIEFDNVVFRYPSRPEIAALNGFSLAVNPGEKVAIVGPSGAGKSTVFQLMLRFYDAEAGRILVDGADIMQADPVEVRRRYGLVAQDPVMFAATAMENIRYGRPEASDEEVFRAAQAAGAAEFLDRLPEGYDTPLGERGQRLSGGQRQRIAIARALLRDPSILLLDEATSALDAESERMVQGALELLMQGRTTLVIAHRLATVLKADRIIVMDQGRVVASGTHKELMAQEGLYARLAKLQFDTGRDALGGEQPADAAE
ncbi:ABC transporter transmembrane domain-containing protein [Minwuia thermotolerans]|uniref:ABC transporter transmembrane domain-containing protein n=1 Tax=Minwuia thermotolerans TaxID=2056226 RepID=UPI0019D298E9|nr:ABC transporter transmembrane domain-containing protein [Minwuia thermotolerans]